MQVEVALCRPWRLTVNDEVELHTLVMIALDGCVSFTALSQLHISAVSALHCCARSKNAPSKFRQCAFWHNRMHCDVIEVNAFGFLPPLNGRHCSSAPRLRTHSNLPGVFRKDWETGTHSTQCLFWHFTMTCLCLCICIYRHIPSSRHFRPPWYWASWCSASTWGGTAEIVA